MRHQPLGWFYKMTQPHVHTCALITNVFNIFILFSASAFQSSKKDAKSIVGTVHLQEKIPECPTST